MHSCTPREKYTGCLRRELKKSERFYTDFDHAFMKNKFFPVCFNGYAVFLTSQREGFFVLHIINLEMYSFLFFHIRYN